MRAVETISTSARVRADRGHGRVEELRALLCTPYHGGAARFEGASVMVE
jgi:hypothetical protein